MSYQEADHARTTAGDDPDLKAQAEEKWEEARRRERKEAPAPFRVIQSLISTEGFEALDGLNPHISFASFVHIPRTFTQADIERFCEITG